MSTKTEFQHTAKNAGIIGLTASLGAVFGFVLQLLVAYYYGAGQQTDAFFMAQSTSDLLSKMLMGGSVTAIFIPLFIERLTKHNKSGAWDLALNIVNSVAFVYLILIAIVFFFATQFVHLIAPGFDAEATRLTVSMLRILLPSFFFLFMVEFATSMLQSLKNFSLPAMLRIVTPSISIICIILLVHTIGIYALAVGVVVGSVVQLSILAYGLKKEGMRYRFFIHLKDPALHNLIRLVYPFIFSVIMTQGAGIVYRVLVSGLEEGSLSALKFAEKITQLITIIFINSVTLVIYPMLSEKASVMDMAGIRNTLGRSMRLIVFTTLPLIITVAILRQPIVDIIYRHGSFSPQDAYLTSLALLYLVLGLTTTGISSVLGHAILALQETKAAVAITIASQVVAIALFIILVPHMGLAGLALASSLVPLSSAALYYFYLRKFVPGLYYIFKHIAYIKIIVITAVSCTAVFVLRPLFAFNEITEIIIPLAVGVALYSIFAYMWKLEEMHEVLEIIMKKISKKKLV
jgi:putative peptidoglycan lipid II flippase